MAGLGGAMGYMMGGIDWGWLGEWAKTFLIDCQKPLIGCVVSAKLLDKLSREFIFNSSLN